MDKQIVNQKDFANNQTQNIVAIEKTKYSVVKLKSNVNGWYYNSAIPLSEPEEKLVIIKNLAVVCFILSLAIGIGISITFSRNNSNKVNSIIKLFGGESAQDKGDEYDYIKGRIGDLIQRQSRMMEKLNKQDVIVKSVLLNRLLTGKLKDDDNISELYESLNINPEESVFTVMLIDTEKLESRLMNAKLEGKDYAFIPGIVSYIVQDSLKIKSKEQYEVLVTELDNLTACLLIKLTKSKNNAEFFTEISEVVSLFREDFIKEFEIDMAIALSRVHIGLTGVNEAYNEASDVMEYIKLVGVNTIIYAENVKFKENDIDAYSDKTRELFKNYIKVEDYEAAKKLLSDTFEKQLNNGEIPPIAVLNGQIISFMNAFLGAISELDVELSQSVFEYLKPSNRLIKCRSILEIQTEIRALLDELSDFVIRKRSELQGSHKKLITDYIEENITDANLSVTIIAEHFGMTQSNLSKYFKKEFGIGILEYIHQLRLELAKKLIIQDISLKEISQRVGLYNDIALIRIFKKYENITPKNYREKIINKQ
jgi:AraC-like DNA-binding protein